jgi:hypothetical protein
VNIDVKEELVTLDTKRTIAIIPGPEPADTSPGRPVCSGQPGRP